MDTKYFPRSISKQKWLVRHAPRLIAIRSRRRTVVEESPGPSVVQKTTDPVVRDPTTRPLWVNLNREGERMLVDTNECASNLVEPTEHKRPTKWHIRQEKRKAKRESQAALEKQKGKEREPLSPSPSVAASEAASPPVTGSSSVATSPSIATSTSVAPPTSPPTSAPPSPSSLSLDSEQVEERERIERANRDRDWDDINQGVHSAWELQKIRRHDILNGPAPAPTTDDAEYRDLALRTEGQINDLLGYSKPIAIPAWVLKPTVSRWKALFDEQEARRKQELEGQQTPTEAGPSSSSPSPSSSAQPEAQQRNRPAPVPLHDAICHVTPEQDDHLQARYADISRAQHVLSDRAGTYNASMYNIHGSGTVHGGHNFPGPRLSQWQALLNDDWETTFDEDGWPVFGLL